MAQLGERERDSYMPTRSLEEDGGEGPGAEEEANPEGAQPTCLTTGASCTA